MATDWRGRLCSFPPSIFAAVMGTGIFSISSLYYSEYLPFLRFLSLALLYFNTALFFLLLVPWIGRWILCREDSLKDLTDPIKSSFYPTIAISLLVLSSSYIVILGDISLGMLFWFVGVVLTVFFAILVPYIMFGGTHVHIDHINPAWCIPPVGLIVIPVAGARIMSMFTGLIHDAILLLNVFGWGAGFFLYISLSAVCMYRFLLHRPLPNTLAPTIWINLGPIGVGIISLLSIGKVSTIPSCFGTLTFLALLLWGYGLWWLIMAIVMTLHYLRKLSLPYALSWWAFTFPLGAYAASTYLLAHTISNGVIGVAGFFIYLLLAFLWSLTAFKSAAALVRGLRDNAIKDR